MKIVWNRERYFLVALTFASLLILVAAGEGIKRTGTKLRVEQTDRNETHVRGAAKEVDQREDGIKRIFEAAAEADNATIKRLVQSGVSINSRDESGRTPLFYAATGGRQDPSTVRMLLHLGADVNARDKLGNTALLLAMDPGGTLAVVKALLEAGADVNIANLGGETPLMIASDWAYPTEMLLLLRRKADPNRQRATDGKTALMFASDSGKPEAVDILLKNGADPLIKDKDGRTALMLAEEDYLKNRSTMNRYMRTGTSKIIKLLGQAGSHPPAR